MPCITRGPVGSSTWSDCHSAHWTMLMDSCSEKSVETHCVAPLGYCGFATPVPEKGVLHARSAKYVASRSGWPGA